MSFVCLMWTVIHVVLKPNIVTLNGFQYGLKSAF